MLSIIGLFIGCGLTAFGLATMRNPILFSRIRVEGYYQRMVLDKRFRLELRMVGMFFSFFGLTVFTGAWDGVSHLGFAHALCDAFLALSCLSFMLGVAYAIVHAIQGGAAESYKIWKQSIELGPVAAFPTFAPHIDREKNLFTVIYAVLVGVALVIAFFIASPS